MKVVREFIRKYYKWTEWTQPVLTSNNTSTELGNIITTSSTYYNSNTQPYMIMNGTTSTTTDVGYWQLAGKTTEEWLNIKFPYKLKISALSVVTRPNDNYNRTFSVYDGVGGEQIGSSITPTAGATRYTIVSSGEYITDNIFIKVHAQSTEKWFGLQNLQIKAQYAKDTVSSDYDYYIDVPVLKLPGEIIRKYYKYVDSKIPNVTLNGSLTQNNGIVSDFNSNNYFSLQMPSYNYELVLNITTGSDVNEQQNLLGNQSGDNSFAVGIKSNKFALIDKTSGVQEASCTATGGTVSANTNYFVKVLNTGTAISSQTSLHYSTDGKTYTQACTISQDQTYVSPCPFGSQYTKDSTWYAFKGNMNLSKSYLINAGEKINFTQIIKQETTSSDYEYYRDVPTYYGINQ